MDFGAAYLISIAAWLFADSNTSRLGSKSLTAISKSYREATNLTPTACTDRSWGRYDLLPKREGVPFWEY